MKIIIFDLDGTILQDNKISPYCLDVINTCKKKDYWIGIVTARPYYSAMPFAQMINPNILIASSRSWVYVNSVVLQNLLLDESDCKYILHFLENARLGKQIIVGGLEQYYCTFEKCKEWVGYENAILVDCCNFHISCSYKIILPINEKSVALEQSKMMNNYGIASYNNLKWLRITRKDVTKLSAVQFVLSYIGASFSDVISFGDDDDDCDILKNSNLGIAVKNATNNLKNQANYICDSISEDGVPKWICANLL